MWKRKDEKTTLYELHWFLVDLWGAPLCCKSLQIWHKPTVIWNRTWMNITKPLEKKDQKSITDFCSVMLASLGLGCSLLWKYASKGRWRQWDQTAKVFSTKHHKLKNRKQTYSLAAFIGSSMQGIDKGGKLVMDFGKLRNKVKKLEGTTQTEGYH